MNNKIRKITLIDEGVVLVKNAWEAGDVKRISEDYDKLDQTLKNSEIVKDKPIIVFGNMW